MTYRDLLAELSRMTDEQLSCDLTVELAIEDECIPAELRICGPNHDVLDEDHPVIYVEGF